MSIAPLIRHSDLVARGHDPNEIRSLVRSGRLHRVRHGVYSYDRPAGMDAHLQLLRATVPIVDAGNVISHASAGVLHGLPVPAEYLDRVWMTRRSPGHGDHGKQLVVRHTPIHDDEVRLSSYGPVTSLSRTASDLARTLEPRWGLAAVDAALRLGTSEADLYSSLALHPKLRGTRRARHIIRIGDARAESPAESISRYHMRTAGLPLPELQYDHFDADGVFVARSDFFWPEYGLVGEVDGAGKYEELLRPGQTPTQAIMAEKRRDEALRSLGLWVIHWDWQTANDEAALTVLLAGALRRQAGRLAG